MVCTSAGSAPMPRRPKRRGFLVSMMQYTYLPRPGSAVGNTRSTASSRRGEAARSRSLRLAARVGRTVFDRGAATILELGGGAARADTFLRAGSSLLWVLLAGIGHLDFRCADAVDV